MRARVRAWWLVAVLGCGVGVVVAQVVGAAAAKASVADEAGRRDLWVEVWVNQVAEPEFALLHIDLRGHLFVRAEALRAWHFRARGSAEAEGLVRIDDWPGLRARLEEGALFLEAEPALFEAQIIPGGPGFAAPEWGVPAFFMGYNLFTERESGAALGATYSALVQPGASLGRTSFTSTWLGLRTDAASESAGWRRLDSDVLIDFPEYTARLTLGDSVTSPDTLGRAVRFVGAHWATDYGTRPAVSPYALPVINGTATVPSTVELYVNQALVQRTAVDAGPFRLNNIPVPMGQGMVDIRMRDILGQEQSLVVPYLAAPQLLAAGLTVSDLAGGLIRADYGTRSFSYGTGFLSGGMWHGVSDATTVNSSVELVPDARELTTRAGAAVRVNPNTLVELNPAVSHAAQHGTGAAVDAGIDSLWSWIALGVHFRDASPAFVEMGNLGTPGRLHTEWAARTSAQFGAQGSVALVYARRRVYGGPTNTAATLSYNVGWRRVGALGVFVSNVACGITFTRYLGGGVTSSLTGTAENGVSTVDMRVGRPAPPDAGWGWSLAHARGGVESDGLRVDARSAYGSGSGEIDAQPAGKSGLLAWQGGFLWAAGRAWPAQSLTGPAALVEVPGIAGLEVLRDGQPAGRTDSAGRLLVAGLRPFESNTLTLVPEDLPPTAMIASDKLIVRPFSHGILSAVMGVAALESRLFTLRLAVDAVVPAGASVSLAGQTFPVGAQGIAQLPVGRVEVDALVSWRGGQCRIRVPGLSGLSDALRRDDGSWAAQCRKL